MYYHVNINQAIYELEFEHLAVTIELFLFVHEYSVRAGCRETTLLEY